VIRNLLSNAGKYGGPDVRIEGAREGRTYLIVVSDDGDGLPDEIVANAFQRFVHQGHETATTDSVGLGLSIVNSLADGMGGSVKYERVDGRTRFLVRLPLVQSAARPINWTTTTASDATTDLSVAEVASAVAPGVGASGV
jgi:signal transduction histidine kinase